MLSRMALEAALEIVESLNNQGVKITPNEYTPLEMLTDASAPVTVIDPNVLTNDVIIDVLDETSTDVAALSPIDHDTEMESIRNLIVNQITKRLHVARNVAKPIISDLVARIEERLLNIGRMNVPDIIELDINEFYRHPALADMFLGYRFDIIEQVNGFTEISEEVFEEMLERVQEEPVFSTELIKEIVAKYPEIVNTVRMVYCDGLEVPIIGKGLTPNSNYELATNTLIHVIGRLLLNSDFLGRNRIHQFQERLYLLLSRTAANILTLANEFKVAANQNNLIVSSESHRIVVHGKAYASFIKQGGTHAQLAGFTLKVPRINQNRYSVEAILENAEEYDETYIQEARTLAVNTANQRTDIIYNVLMDNASRINETIINEVFPDADPKERYANALKYLSSFYPIIDDPYEMAMRFVCDGFLPEYEIRAFFTRINELVEGKHLEGTGYLPDQAVYFILLDEIITHLLTQVSLSKKGA